MLLVGSVVVVVVVVVMKKENMESVNKWSGTNQARTNTIDGLILLPRNYTRELLSIGMTQYAAGQAGILSKNLWMSSEFTSLSLPKYPVPTGTRQPSPIPPSAG